MNHSHSNLKWFTMIPLQIEIALTPRKELGLNFCIQDNYICLNLYLIQLTTKKERLAEIFSPDECRTCAKKSEIYW